MCLKSNVVEIPISKRRGTTLCGLSPYFDAASSSKFYFDYALKAWAIFTVAYFTRFNRSLDCLFVVQVLVAIVTQEFI